jgi:diguanylate cyclase (GGDEF)-like protein
MSIEQFLLLVGVTALLVLLLMAAITLGAVLWRRRAQAQGPSIAERVAIPGDPILASALPGADAVTVPEVTSALPPEVHQQAVRVLAYTFIAAALLIGSFAGVGDRPLMISVLALGLLATVLLQDVLPARALGQWQLWAEAVIALGVVTALVALSGGPGSPYYIGFVLVVGAGALWSTATGALLLALGGSVAYLVAVFVAQPTDELRDGAFERVAFNVLLLVLVALLGWITGREQRRVREADLEKSRFDALTGLFTRGYFLSRLEGEVQRSARSRRPFSMLMIDLDGLKAANDRFGHAAGDVLLRSVADVIKASLRGTDVAGRYGGDELLVLLPETGAGGAIRVAEKVRLDIARLALPRDGSALSTTVSIGVVTCPFDGRSTHELVRSADAAMYEAKRRGRNQIVHYDHQQEGELAPFDVPPADVPAAPPWPQEGRRERFVPVMGEAAAEGAPEQRFAGPGMTSPWSSMRR